MTTCFRENIHSDNHSLCAEVLEKVRHERNSFYINRHTNIKTYLRKALSNRSVVHFHPRPGALNIRRHFRNFSLELCDLIVLQCRVTVEQPNSDNKPHLTTTYSLRSLIDYHLQLLPIYLIQLAGPLVIQVDHSSTDRAVIMLDEPSS